MAFKAINNTARPNKLVLILLVYSIYPRITEHDPLLLSITQRALTIKKAIAKVQKLQAKRQVNDALYTRNSPNTFNIYKLPLNSDILI
jgi:hypothetical protein